MIPAATRFYQKHHKPLGKAFLAIALLLVAFLQLKTFLQGHSLMIDEANVARNIAERSFQALWQPLDYEQYAPPLYLTFVKLSTLLFGMNEYALRAPALLSFFLSLFLFIRLGRHTELRLSYPLLSALVFLYACSHITLFQSSLLKQYTTDALWSVLLVYAALKYSYRFLLRPRGVLFWTLMGSVAIWFSMPSVFILAAVGIYYCYQSAQEGKLQPLLRSLSIPVILWLAQFAVYFLTILKSDAESDYLQNYHNSYFFESTLWKVESWVHNGKIISGILQVYLGKTAVVFIWVGLVSLAGIYNGMKSRFSLMLLLIVPLLIAVGASFFHYYSFIPRLMLFYLPLFLLFLGSGLKALWQRFRWPGRAFLFVSTVYIVAQMSGWKYALPQNQCLMEETREVLDELPLPRDGSYSVFVNHSGVPALTFYTKYHDHKARYAPFAEFRPINWDKNPAEEAKAFLQQNPDQQVVLLWGHERNPSIEREVQALQGEPYVVQKDLEKTMARAVILKGQ